jgi:hypothetical protein
MGGRAIPAKVHGGGWFLLRRRDFTLAYLKAHEDGRLQDKVEETLAHLGPSCRAWTGCPRAVPAIQASVSPSASSSRPSSGATRSMAHRGGDGRGGAVAGARRFYALRARSPTSGGATWSATHEQWQLVCSGGLASGCPCRPCARRAAMRMSLA